jgi:pimeloyl-ACP methyl ester carboxylesterase
MFMLKYCLFCRWEQSAVSVSQSGFSGIIFELPLLPTIEENVQYLHRSLSRNCFRPPVLVTHSIGTFIGQKYLESFPLSGLIMVNPIPPASGGTLRKLMSRWNSQTVLNDRLASYYNVDQSLAKDLALSELNNSA